MRRWRTVAAIGLALILGSMVVAGLLRFLAPEVAYHVRDRGRELFSGQRTYRIGLGATTGAGTQVARVLNRLLRFSASAATNA
jgi:hypothetical protein